VNINQHRTYISMDASYAVETTGSMGDKIIDRKECDNRVLFN